MDLGEVREVALGACALVIAGPGQSGKTSLLASLVSELPDQVPVAVVSYWDFPSSRPFVRLELWESMRGGGQLSRLLTVIPDDAVIALDEVDCAGAAALAAGFLRAGRKVWCAATRAFSGSGAALARFLCYLSEAGGCMFPPGTPDIVVLLGYRGVGKVPRVECVEILPGRPAIRGTVSSPMT